MLVAGRMENQVIVIHVLEGGVVQMIKVTSLQLDSGKVLLIYPQVLSNSIFKSEVKQFVKQAICRGKVGVGTVPHRKQTTNLL